MTDLPTPEQQAATVRRYQGQRAAEAAEPAREAAGKPVAPVNPQKLRGALRRDVRHYAKWSTIWTIGVFLVAAFLGRNGNAPHPTGPGQLAPVYPLLYGFCNHIVRIGLFVILIEALYWICVAGYFYWRAIHRSFQAATAPIPSLQEIELQLRREGYNPSIADCVAVEAHLKSERNEAALLNAALVATPVLLNRQAHGRSL